MSLESLAPYLVNGVYVLTAMLKAYMSENIKHGSTQFIIIILLTIKASRKTLFDEVNVFFFHRGSKQYLNLK